MAVMDLIVVGAGPFGLIAGHTWLELNPSHEVTILESASDLGGVWAQSRMHAAIKTQAPLGMFEFPCFPMRRLPADKTFYGYFPGEHVTAYLEEFSTHKPFEGKTLRERISFDSRVTEIRKEDNEKLWIVSTEAGKVYRSRKLIVATGLTSTPHLPSFSRETFTTPIIHTVSLAASIPTLSSPAVSSVVILGGSKSAFDAGQLLSSINISRTTPLQITWVVRSIGRGPAWLAAASAPWPYKCSHEMISTRLVGRLNPYIFSPYDSWTHFWHGNRLGIWLADCVWNAVGWMWMRIAGFERSEDMDRVVNKSVSQSSIKDIF